MSILEPADVEALEEMDAILRNLSSSPLKESLARLSVEDDGELNANGIEGHKDVVRQVRAQFLGC